MLSHVRRLPLHQSGGCVVGRICVWCNLLPLVSVVFHCGSGRWTETRRWGTTFATTLAFWMLGRRTTPGARTTASSLSCPAWTTPFRRYSSSRLGRSVLPGMNYTVPQIFLITFGRVRILGSRTNGRNEFGRLKIYRMDIWPTYRSPNGHWTEKLKTHSKFE